MEAETTVALMTGAPALKPLPRSAETMTMENARPAMASIVL